MLDVQSICYAIKIRLIVGVSLFPRLIQRNIYRYVPFTLLHSRSYTRRYHGCKFLNYSGGYMST